MLHLIADMLHQGRRVLLFNVWARVPSPCSAEDQAQHLVGQLDTCAGWSIILSTRFEQHRSLLDVEIKTQETNMQ